MDIQTWGPIAFFVAIAGIILQTAVRIWDGTIAGEVKSVSDRQKYVRAMMKAIKSACLDTFEHVNIFHSKTDGLRAIRKFESVNGIRFNPHDEIHIDKISGCARWENMFRKVKIQKTR